MYIIKNSNIYKEYMPLFIDYFCQQKDFTSVTERRIKTKGMETITETDKDFCGMATCFFCGEVKHLLLARVKKTLPPSACYDKEPCDNCKKIMEVGVIFIGVKDGEQEKKDNQNPYRTGQIIGIKEEAVKKMINEPLLSQVLKSRVCFIEEGVLKKMGLITKTGKLKYKKKFKKK